MSYISSNFIAVFILKAIKKYGSIDSDKYKKGELENGPDF